MSISFFFYKHHFKYFIFLRWNNCRHPLLLLCLGEGNSTRNRWQATYPKPKSTVLYLLVYTWTMSKLSINLQVSQRNYAFINMGDFFCPLLNVRRLSSPSVLHNSSTSACQYFINSKFKPKLLQSDIWQFIHCCLYCFPHTAYPLFCHLKGNYLLLFFCLIRLQIGKVGCSSLVRVGGFCVLICYELVQSALLCFGLHWDNRQTGQLINVSLAGILNVGESEPELSICGFAPHMV